MVGNTTAMPSPTIPKFGPVPMRSAEDTVFQ